jgi:uncharacterized protein
MAAEEKLLCLLKESKKFAVAFSGGVDSVYLLYAAVKSGADVTAYYVRSAFQPEFEFEDAKKAAEITKTKMKVINLDILASDEVAANPPDRCYHCKKRIFGAIVEAAKKDGYSLIFDGTNASDDSADRPGMKALKEMKVRSPLRECGLTKKEIRKLSKEAGLFTWEKPSYACLATRIPAGDVITAEKLNKTEKAEDFLTGLGFKNFRVRMIQDSAKLQITKEDMPLLLEKRTDVLKELKKYYSDVYMDLEERS